MISLSGKCDNLPIQMKGACIVPKRANDVMKGEVEKMLVLNKDSVVPVSYTILRRVSYSTFVLFKFS